MAAKPRSSVSSEELLAQLAWMRALAQHLVYDPQLADDVLQQACLLALERGPDSARHGAGLRAWLAGVTRRLAEHSGRARTRRLKREREAARPEALPSTLDTVQQREALRGLVEALTELEEPHYSTIVGRYFEGLSVEALAARASITPAAVRQRLSRAKQQLRTRLEHRIAEDRGGWLVLALTGGLLESSGQAIATHAGAARLGAAQASAAVRHGGELIMAKTFGTASLGKAAATVLVILSVTWLLWPERGARGDEAPTPPLLPTATAGAAEPAAVAADLPAPRESEPQALRPVHETAAPIDVAPAAQPPTGSVAASGTLDVVVVDREARPVPWAFVDALRPGPPVNPGLRQPAYATVASARADAGGRCTITLPEPDDLLVASHESLGSSGILTSREQASLLNADGDTVVRLMPYLTVEGLVLDAADQPVAGCPVAIQTTGHSPSPRPAAPVFTGADGRFHVQVDHATQYSIGTAWRTRIASEIVNPKPGEPVWVTLQLPGDWSISGTLTDDQGALISAAKVVAWPAANEADRDLAAPAPSGHFRIPITAETAADGSFVVPITALGSYGLTALAPDRTIPEPVWVDIAGAEAHPTVALVLPTAVAIAGHVVDLDGAPLRRATVEVRAAPPTLLDGTLFLVPSVARTRSTTTHKDGSFSVEPLPASGVYKIRAYFQRSRFPPAARPDDDDVSWEPVAAGSADVVLVASEVEPRQAELRISVASEAPGAALEDVLWCVVPEGETQGHAVGRGTYADGVIVVADLDRESEYTVAVAAKGLGAVDLHHVVPTAEGPPLSVALPPFGALSATVVDSHGAGVPYARIEIRRSFVLIREFLGAIGVPPRPADTDGLARFDDLDPGTYTVTATALDQRVESVVEVPAGGRATLRLELTASR